MKVIELINILKEYTQELVVITEGYENGFNEIKQVLEILIESHPKKEWWDGEFQKTEKNGIAAIYLQGRKENS